MTLPLASEGPPPARIPLFDLDRQRARLRHEIDRRVARVIDHGQFILGPEVAELEHELAAFAGVGHAVGVSSGRDALIMALMAHGIGAGDGVLVPAFTFSATAAVVVSAGAVPVFVDVRERDFAIDPEAIAQAAERARSNGLCPRAVMPVDLFGRPAAYPAIAAAAANEGLVVIADAAQSFGGESPEGMVGALAPITCVSFYPTKPLGGFGDGGAILTGDDALAESVLQIRTHGRQGDGDEALRIGMTGRLDTLQAAVLIAKLAVFKAELRRRREIAALYHERLAGACVLPPPDAAIRSAWALYTVRVADRDGVRERLAQAGVATGLFYRVPLPVHAAFAHCDAGAQTPVADRLAREVLSLPIGPDMTDDEVERVCEAVLDAL